MRHLLLVPCLLALAAIPADAAEPPAPPVASTAAATVLTEAERQAIDRVIEALIAAGIPDARGATLILGEVEVSEPVAEKPAKDATAIELGEESEDDGDAAMFHMGGGRVRVADGKRITTWRGSHLLLADGRWLMQCSTPVTPSAKLTITPAAEAKRLAPADVPAHLAKNARRERHPGMDEQETAWLNLFDAASRPRIAAAIKASQALEGLGGSVWGGGLGIAMLYRAGVPGVGEAILLGGQMQQMQRRQPKAKPTAMPLILDHDSGMWGARAWLGGDGEDDEEMMSDPKAWMEKRKGTLGIVDPAPMLNQQLAAWFGAMVRSPTGRNAFGFTAEQASKLAVAFTPEAERAAARDALALLEACKALPEKAPAGADLATRLQSWEPSQQHMYMSQEDEEEQERHMPDEAMIAQLPAEQQAHFRKEMERRKAWRPSEADLPGLLDLLTDPRPSRWIDGTTGHTLGDSALRALFTVMRVDPRTVAGRDPLKPWDDDERKASAEAIRAWWKAQGGKPLAEALIADLERLPLHAAVTIISKRKPDQRAPLLDRIATTLPAQPDKKTAADALARLLALAGDHAAINAKVSAWPLSGSLRPLLAVWNDQQGRPAELDKLLDELLAAGDADDTSASRLGTALKQAMAKPSPVRLQRALALAAGPLTDRRTWTVLGAASGQGGYSFDQEWMPVQQYEQMRQQQGQGRIFRHDEERSDPAHAIPLAVVCTLLADRRVVPQDAMQIQMNADWGQIRIHGLGLSVQLRERGAKREAAAEAAKPKPDPTGLRVCDLTAIAARYLTYQVGAHELGEIKVDLWADAAARDAALRPAAEAFAEKGRAALAAAKLPDVLPAAAPADAKALF